MRYIQYLEEQRSRDERNHKLLAALDKVTNKLALISAKKDRLNVLRVSVYYFNQRFIIILEKLIYHLSIIIKY